MAADEQSEPILAEETYTSDDDGGVTDAIRRALSTGVRTVLKSEENIRAFAGEILRSDKVEAVGSVLTNVREDVVRVAGREVVKYLERLNLTDEVVKVLTAISLEVKTEIRFIPNDKRLVKPDIKAAVKVKGTGSTKKKKRKARAKKV